MDSTRFDRLVLALAAAPSRRTVLNALGSVALGATLGPLLPGVAAAACRQTRERCKRGTQCCSGVCKRQRGTRKKTCRRTPHQGSCTIKQDACQQGVAAACAGPGSSCYCFLTARGASFCGRGNTVDSCAQCESQFPGRFCLPGSGPQCGAVSCVEPCAG